MTSPDAAELESRRRARAAERDRRRALRRRRLIAAALTAAVALAAVLVVAAGGHRGAHRAGSAAGSSPAAGGGGTQPPAPSSSPANPPPVPHAPFAVGVRVLRFRDASRQVRLPGSGVQPRPLVTIVRYPALGRASGRDLPGAAAARAAGPFPLIVFGHGFAVTPGLYNQLMRAWAQAGYVVAAPVFPLENANAPGGPNESDLVNQPQDMRVVITRMLATSAASGGALGGVIDASRIAAAGQSDGGDSALALAYNPRNRDARVRAAAILSGAEIPNVAFSFARRVNPPLLATQGDSDPINPPKMTHAFYDYAPRPKFLLDLHGATHLPPYTGQQPQLGVVERVTIAFFDAYLRHRGGPKQIAAAGNVAGVATLRSQP